MIIFSLNILQKRSQLHIRRCVIKVLLYPRTFETKCPYCDGGFKDILKHFLLDCSYISPQRKAMNDKLRLYNFPGKITIYNIESFIAKTLENRLWVKCLAEFLIEIKFYKKTEDATIAEPIEL